MPIDLFRRSKSAFLISVGEEGAVIVYIVNNIIIQKFFTKSTEPHDTQRLVQLLSQDRNAKIHILLDTLDQTYVQKAVPGLSSFSIDGIAKSRIEREVPADYLKCVVQLYKNSTSRREWMYTFISAPYENNISKWVEFFAPFQNIIEGIHFLPIELGNIVPMLRDGKHFRKRTLASLLPKQFQKEEKHGWEILFTQNKTGGFRQVALLDGKIIFSRLITNINTADPDVLAGNIEEEINNSIEFTNRLSLGSEENVTVYFVLANEVLRALRIERIKAKSVKLFSPFSFAKKIGALEAATERDKFCDPSILYAIGKLGHFTASVHVKASEKIYTIALYVDYAKRFFDITTPIAAIAIVFFISQFIKNQLDIINLRDKIRTVNVNIEQKRLELDSLKNKIVDKLAPEEVSAIVQIDDFFAYNNESPLSLMMELSSIMPEYARVKKLNWFYTDPEMMNFKRQQGAKYTDVRAKRPYAVEMDFEILFVEPGDTYEELHTKYTKLTQLLKGKFPNYQITLSDLPKNINFATLGTKIEISASILYGVNLEGMKYVAKRS